MPCASCGEVPTEPISPQRLEYQVATWLCERGEERLLPMLRLVTEDAEGEGVDRCIFTGNPVSICSQCYVRRVHAMLLSVAPVLTGEFVQFFTFADERSEFPVERKREQQAAI